MMFLVCGHDKVRTKVVLQQLLVTSFTPNEPTTFLHSWACEIKKTNTNWRDILLESLCIIQAKAVIRKLGLNYIDLEQRFLPQNLSNALFIHPIVKLLYLVSEEFTVNESKQLIDRIATKSGNVQNFIYQDNGERLEIYLMYWLTEDLLNIGRQTTTTQNNNDEMKTCNLDLILEYLKQIERDALKEIVSSVCNQFNSVRNSLINRTDGKQSDDTGVSSLNFNATSNSSQTTDDSYKIQKSNAGIVLIVNQKTFFPDKHPDLRESLPTRMLETRHGTDQDVISLKRTFSAFGYRIIVRNNLIHTDLLTVVRSTVNECAGKDSLIVCILSHGYRGVVYGANSIPIKIEDIENVMISDRLIGKPKILIVQACQGDVTQQAREVNVFAFNEI